MSMKTALRPEELDLAVGGAEDPILEYTVRWYDEAGNEYSYTVKNRQPVDPGDFIISQTVTWEDGNGNQFSNTVRN